MESAFSIDKRRKINGSNPSKLSDSKPSKLPLNPLNYILSVEMSQSMPKIKDLAAFLRLSNAGSTLQSCFNGTISGAELNQDISTL
jgi:hypothetical protein